MGSDGESGGNFKEQERLEAAATAARRAEVEAQIGKRDRRREERRSTPPPVKKPVKEKTPEEREKLKAAQEKRKATAAAQERERQQKSRGRKELKLKAQSTPKDYKAFLSTRTRPDLEAPGACTGVPRPDRALNFGHMLPPQLYNAPPEHKEAFCRCSVRDDGDGAASLGREMKPGRRFYTAEELVGADNTSYVQRAHGIGPQRRAEIRKAGGACYQACNARDPKTGALCTYPQGHEFPGGTLRHSWESSSTTKSRLDVAGQQKRAFGNLGCVDPAPLQSDLFTDEALCVQRAKDLFRDVAPNHRSEALQFVLDTWDGTVVELSDGRRVRFVKRTKWDPIVTVDGVPRRQADVTGRRKHLTQGLRWKDERGDEYARDPLETVARLDGNAAYNYSQGDDAIMSYDLLHRCKLPPYECRSDKAACYGVLRVALKRLYGDAEKKLPRASRDRLLELARLDHLYPTETRKPELRRKLIDELLASHVIDRDDAEILQGGELPDSVMVGNRRMTLYGDDENSMYHYKPIDMSEAEFFKDEERELAFLSWRVESGSADGAKYDLRNKSKGSPAGAARLGEVLLQKYAAGEELDLMPDQWKSFGLQHARRTDFVTVVTANGPITFRPVRGRTATQRRAARELKEARQTRRKEIEEDARDQRADAGARNARLVAAARRREAREVWAFAHRDGEPLRDAFSKRVPSSADTADGKRSYHALLEQAGVPNAPAYAKKLLKMYVFALEAWAEAQPPFPRPDSATWADLVQTVKRNVDDELKPKPKAGECTRIVGPDTAGVDLGGSRKRTLCVRAPAKIENVAIARGLLGAELARPSRAQMDASCQGAISGLYPYQRFVAGWVRPDKTAHNMLVVHSTGTGKTCTIVGIVATSRAMPREAWSPIVLLAPPANLSNLYTTIADPKRGCGVLELAGSAATKKDEAKCAELKIYGYSYVEFANRLLQTTPDDAFWQNVFPDGEHSRTLIIADEFHLFVAPVSNQTKSKTDDDDDEPAQTENESVDSKTLAAAAAELKRRVTLNQGLQIAAFTATPIKNDAWEAGKALDLLVKKGQPRIANTKETFQREYLDDPVKGLPKLKALSSHLISYFDGSRDYSKFPVSLHNASDVQTYADKRIDNPIAPELLAMVRTMPFPYTPWPKAPDGGANDDAAREARESFGLVRVPMSALQYAKFRAADDNQAKHSDAGKAHKQQKKDLLQKLQGVGKTNVGIKERIAQLKEREAELKAQRSAKTDTRTEVEARLRAAKEELAEQKRQKSELQQAKKQLNASAKLHTSVDAQTGLVFQRIVFGDSTDEATSRHLNTQTQACNVIKERANDRPFACSAWKSSTTYAPIRACEQQTMFEDVKGECKLNGLLQDCWQADLEKTLNDGEKGVSRKLWAMLSNIRHFSKGKQFVFANASKQYGVNAIAAALWSAGYTQLSFKVDTATKKYVAEGAVEDYKGFVVLPSSTNERLLEAMLALYNSQENAYGQKCAIMVAGRRYAQGIDAPSTFMHKFDEAQDEATNKQSEARVARACGHRFLPMTWWFTFLFSYASTVPNDNGILLTDGEAIVSAKRQAKQYGAVNQTLRQAAIDAGFWTNIQGNP